MVGDSGLNLCRRDSHWRVVDRNSYQERADPWWERNQDLFSIRFPLLKDAREFLEGALAADPPPGIGDGHDQVRLRKRDYGYEAVCPGGTTISITRDSTKGWQLQGPGGLRFHVGTLRLARMWSAHVDQMQA